MGGKLHILGPTREVAREVWWKVGGLVRGKSIGWRKPQLERKGEGVREVNIIGRARFFQIGGGGGTDREGENKRGGVLRKKSLKGG